MVFMATTVLGAARVGYPGRLRASATGSTIRRLSPTLRVPGPNRSWISTFTEPPRRSFASKASNKDFDSILMDAANKFEQAENKVAIAGWFVAAFAAITMAEWLIHLPGLNVLLGFPVQLLGLIATGNLALRYFVDKEGDMMGDLEALVTKVSKRLPGL